VWEWGEEIAVDYAGKLLADRGTDDGWFPTKGARDACNRGLVSV
jgi:hypothetical protein